MAAQTGVPVATAYVTGTGTAPASNAINIKHGSGNLFTLSITGATASITIYDSLITGTSGTGAIVNTSNILYSTTTGALGQVVLFSLPFQTGLSLVATSANSLAISYN